jgi:hypothetical protein
MRHSILSLIFAAGFASGMCACSSTQQTTQVVPETDCGVERWSVKNLLDADSGAIDATPQSMTLSEVDAIPRSTFSLSSPRMAIERRKITVQATVVEIKREDDGDVHLLLSDSVGNPMIAEIPDPDACSDVAHSGHASEYRSVLAYVKSHFGNPTSSFKAVNKPVTITGVIFQDFSHNQRGEAPNSIEIHPVLAIQ